MNLQTFYADDKFELHDRPFGRSNARQRHTTHHHRWGQAGNRAECKRLGQRELQCIRYLWLPVQHSGQTARICAVLNMDTSNIPSNAFIVRPIRSRKMNFLVNQLCGPFCGRINYAALICPTFAYIKIPLSALMRETRTCVSSSASSTKWSFG